MVRQSVPFAPETRVGLAGAVLLAGAYLALGPPASVSSPLEIEPFLPYVAAAFVVGILVGALSYWHVPATRRSRRAHLRTVALMLGGPLIVLGFGLLILGAGFAMFLNAFDVVTGMAQGGGSAVAGPFLALLLAMVIIALVMIGLMIVGLIIAAALLQISAILGYAAAVLSLAAVERVTT